MKQMIYLNVKTYFLWKFFFFEMLSAAVVIVALIKGQKLKKTHCH